MNRIGHIDDSKFAKAKAIHDAIFRKAAAPSRDFSFEWQGQKVEVGYFANKKLAFARHGSFLYVQQNPKSNSPYAARAASGARILWVIQEAKKRGEEDVWIGRIEDGQIFEKP